MRKFFNKKARQRLRLKTLDGHEIHVVEGDNPKSLALLARAYKDVYEPAFPMKEERESLESWVANLKSGHVTAKITISILGEKLDTDTPVLKGMTVGYYYDAHDVGLLAYIVTAPAFRGKGLGRVINAANNAALMQYATNKGAELKGIFLETNDPKKIKPEDDVMDPQARVDMYKKWNAVVLPIDYVQPPLERDAAKCDTLLLMAYPHPVTGKYPTKEAIKGYITGIYTELAEAAGCKPEDNPDYIRAMKQIDAMAPLAAPTNDNLPKQKPPKPPKAA